MSATTGTIQKGTTSTGPTSTGPAAALNRPIVVDFAQIPPVDCPCGQSRRALGDAEGTPFSLHTVEISVDARTHYHRRLTETYYILACGPDARMELDGESVVLRPGMAVVIPPGVRHRAVGSMRILNIVTPPFDPADEYFD